MKWQSDEDKDRLALFHNELVSLVDKSDLLPHELVFVLDMVSSQVKKLFETALKSEKKKDGN